MTPIFPHLKFYQFNSRKSKNKDTSTSQDSSSTDKTSSSNEDPTSQICDTCHCIHGSWLLVHDDKIQCALNQIKTLESHQPKMKDYRAVADALPKKTMIGYHKDDIDYWAIAMCWRHRARVLMLHMEIAARTGDEEGIARAKAKLEEAGDIMEEKIDETFDLMEKNFENDFQGYGMEVSESTK